MGLQGCFTGVESTPKITYKEVKKQKAVVTQEQRLAATFLPQPFAQWQRGKRFYVTSPRVSLAMTPVSVGTLSRQLEQGDQVSYAGVREVPSVAGGETAEVLFVTEGASRDTVAYRPDATLRELSERSSLSVPFLVELSVVDQMRQALKGNTYYIRTSLWYDEKGNPYVGPKFVPVTVADVVPANENYPARVVFDYADRADAPARRAFVYLTPSVDPEKRAPRGFDSLFYFDDPRKNYPQITPENWANIVRSRVAVGMTRDEAALALGSPKTVDTGHDLSSLYERWGYPDGVYLILQDGLVIRHNQ